MNLLSHQRLCLAALKWLIVLFLLAWAAFQFGCSKAPTTPRPPFSFFVVPVGNSMLPTFAPFEGVTAELIPYDQLKGGDTVLRWHELTHQYIHHRAEFYDQRYGGWQTKGDNNEHQDRSVMYRADFVARTKKVPR